MITRVHKPGFQDSGDDGMGFEGVDSPTPKSEFRTLLSGRFQDSYPRVGYPFPGHWGTILQSVTDRVSSDYSSFRVGRQDWGEVHSVRGGVLSRATGLPSPSPRVRSTLPRPGPSLPRSPHDTPHRTHRVTHTPHPPPCVGPSSPVYTSPSQAVFPCVSRFLGSRPRPLRALCEWDFAPCPSPCAS